MTHTIHDLQQGTPEWFAHRAGCNNASDLAAALGLSSYKKRTELVREIATGITKEIDDATQRRFDDGHRYEALARPLAEAIIGEDLYPMTVSVSIEGLRRPLSASLDGATADDSTNFEHKSLNADLAAALDQGIIPDEYHPQMEQGMSINGATRCLFMASSWDENDNLIAEKHCWYEPNHELRAKIVPVWRQVEEDANNYQHIEHAERPAPEVQIELPALFVQAQGAITSSNMEEYGKALAAKLAEVRAIKLVTDQDFANAKEAAKIFREQCQKLKLAKDAMLAQTVTIGEAARMMDVWHEDLRQTALQLEKDVEREDLAKKRAMVSEAGLALSAHIQALESEIRPIQLSLSRPDFAGALKGKRNYASMQDALDTMLANAKIEADAAARDIRQKLEWFTATDSAYKLLFPDLQTIIHKPAEDFRLTVDSRIAEEKRLEAERERIRKEETEKAVREAARQADIPPVGQAGTPAGPGTSTPASEGGPPPAYAVREQHTDLKTRIDQFFARFNTPKANQANYRAIIMAWEEFKAGNDMEAAA